MYKRALIVIDIQNDYFPGGMWTLDGIHEAAANAAKLIEHARRNGDFVIHIRHEFEMENAPFFLPGTHGSKIHESVLPKEGEPVVLKNYINSFRETNLKDILDNAGIEDLTICGCMNYMCVDAATRAAADYGYNVTLIHDAVAGRTLEFNGVEVSPEQVHAAFMWPLSFAYAKKTMSTDEYLQSELKAA